MWMKTKCLRLLLMLAFFVLFLPSVCSCSESRTYQISEIELTTLQNHLDALEQNNETLKNLLSTSNEDLTQVLEQLMRSQEELATLKIELQKCKTEVDIAQSSLQIANEELQKAAQSFKEYEKERDKVENRLRTQRNIWEALFAVAVGVAIAR